MSRAAPLLALSVILSAPLARAADPLPGTMRLDYQRDAGAASSCPDQQEFRDAMTAHVHRPLFDPAAPTYLVVRLQGRNGWYQGVAELRDAAGAPTWTVPLGPVPRDCSAVVDSLALSIAIKLDPRGSRAAAPVLTPNAHRPFGIDGEVLPMAQMPPLPDVTPSPRPDMVVPPSVTPEPQYRIRLGVSGGVAIAAGPGWAPSFAVDAGVRWRDRPLSLAVEGAFVPPSSGDLPSGSHVVHVTSYRVTGAGVACGHFLHFVFACGVVAAGAIHGTGSAMALNAHPVTLFYAGAGGRGGVEFPLHPHVAVRLAADALLTLGQPVFEAGGLPVYRASLVSGTAGGGLVFIF
jgi:hypothetical protein